MNRRGCSQHSHSHRVEPCLKYLKPGALAKLRDSRISARSNRSLSLSQISQYRSSLPPAPPSDVFPCFSARNFGPRCPQRKKLVAAKPFSFLSDNASPDSPIDALIGDVVAAN